MAAPMQHGCKLLHRTINCLYLRSCRCLDKSHAANSFPLKQFRTYSSGTNENSFYGFPDDDISADPVGKPLSKEKLGRKYSFATSQGATRIQKLEYGTIEYDSPVIPIDDGVLKPTRNKETIRRNRRRMKKRFFEKRNDLDEPITGRSKKVDHDVAQQPDIRRQHFETTADASVSRVNIFDEQYFPFSASHKSEHHHHFRPEADGQIIEDVSARSDFCESNKSLSENESRSKISCSQEEHFNFQRKSIKHKSKDRENLVPSNNKSNFIDQEYFEQDLTSKTAEDSGRGEEMGFVDSQYFDTINSLNKQTSEQSDVSRGNRKLEGQEDSFGTVETQINFGDSKLENIPESGLGYIEKQFFRDQNIGCVDAEMNGNVEENVYKDLRFPGRSDATSRSRTEGEDGHSNISVNLEKEISRFPRQKIKFDRSDMRREQNAGVRDSSIGTSRNEEDIFEEPGMSDRFGTKEAASHVIRIREAKHKHPSVKIHGHTEKNASEDSELPSRSQRTEAENRGYSESLQNDEDVSENSRFPDRSENNRGLRGVEDENAFYVALKIRKKLKEEKREKEDLQENVHFYSGPVDSKGYRITRNQVPDVMNTPAAMVVNLLKHSIVYDKDDIIAISKPYGLPSHGGPGVHMSVAQLLPALAKSLDPSGRLDTLHMVHRLDRQTTGVMLLAKTAKMAWLLHGAFRRREVVKKYWVLTKGVPKPDKGIIDIPIAEGMVGNMYRMVLKPEYKEEIESFKKSSENLFQAITEYHVISSHGNAALVECLPSTGVKHQIRVHLAFGLNTAVLGDHKYSHFNKIAPQRLYPDILQMLGIRQSKVRHLPMMLHAKSLLIPEFLAGQNLYVSCKIPPHFKLNLKRLKIKAPWLK